MKHISHYINKIKAHLSWEYAIYGVILLVFLINARYLSYPDEFVNLLAGQFINAGKVPYKEFFDHHLSFAWYSAAVLLWFSFGSFVKFRILYGVATFLALFATGMYIRRTKRDAYPFYLGFFFLYPFVSVYFWMQIFVADAISALFFSILFWVLIVETHRKALYFKTILATSLVAFFFIFSSLSYIYIGAIFYVWMLYLLFKHKAKPREYAVFILASAAPYLLYGLYLLVSNSWKEFYISNIYYNTKLYIDIPNYVKGGHFFNPFKFALTLIYNFFSGYLPLVSRIRELNFYFPIEFVIALGTLTLFIFLLKEAPFLAILYFFLLSFSAPRSNIIQLKETDYQASVFIMLGLLSTFVVFWRYKLIDMKEGLLEFGKKAAVFVLGLFVLFSSLFLFQNAYAKYFKRYSQIMPSINDTAFAANFFDEILHKGEYYWMGPYEPTVLFHVKNPSLPGKYISLLPQFRDDDYFRNSFLAQFDKNPPELIVYRHEASIFSTPALIFGKFFTDWMSDKYTSIEHIDGIKELKSPSEFNIRTDLYVRDANQAELLQRMKDKGYIESQ